MIDSPLEKWAWHILGAGAMGCWWGSRLILQGNRVTLLMRGQAPDKSQITVEYNKQPHYFQCKTMQLEAVLPPDSSSSLLVAVKAHQTLDALASISDLVPHYRVVVLMQNGMGVVEQIRREFPDLPLLIGITNQGAYRLDALHIVQAGQGDTWLGCLPDEPVQTGADAVNDLIQTSPGPVRWDTHIAARQWTKLAVNCIINGMTVVEGCRNGQLTLPTHKERIAALCEEIEAVLSHFVDPGQRPGIEQEVLRVAAATSENVSSMLQDVHQGRDTEVEFLNGYLCHRADELDLVIPENQRLYSEIRAVVST
jgi:2-dehydropantoate 2-reductase